MQVADSLLRRTYLLRTRRGEPSAVPQPSGCSAARSRCARLARRIQQFCGEDHEKTLTTYHTKGARSGVLAVDIPEWLTYSAATKLVTVRPSAVTRHSMQQQLCATAKSARRGWYSRRMVHRVTRQSDPLSYATGVDRWSWTIDDTHGSSVIPPVCYIPAAQNTTWSAICWSTHGPMDWPSSATDANALQVL